MNLFKSIIIPELDSMHEDVQKFNETNNKDSFFKRICKFIQDNKVGVNINQ